jgi:hypothetical protein
VKTRLDTDQLERLRDKGKRARSFCRLASFQVVEHEFRANVGHLSYAFVQFECGPADDLNRRNIVMTITD